MSNNQHTIIKVLNEKLEEIEKEIWSDVISYTWPISPSIKRSFKEFIEDLASDTKNKKISVILTTSGWQAETTDDMVNILRKNYEIVDFIIPDFAMSAWTILCMSGNDIYMDYSSALWPIDPQIPDETNTRYVPASWYLDRVNELIEKENKWEKLTNSELNIVIKADVWKLKFIEQAKNLTVTLLKDWLVKYKFKNWDKHSNWEIVTDKEKIKRAQQIAKDLWDVSIWHSHWRTINIEKLEDILKLKIKNIEDNQKLYWLIKEYYDILWVVSPDKNKICLHSKKYI